LTPLNIKGVEDLLREALMTRVEKAYLFGSVADGTYKADSDIDIILIKDSSLPFAKRGTEFLDLFEIHPEIDILVYSQVEFDRQLESPGPGFWRTVKQTMRRMI
jgi:predicted nucleotidyltransferase